ncbi:hypothetical protein [Fervidobacterium sp.]
MKVNYITLAFLIVLTLFIVDVFTHNNISNNIHSILSTLAAPLYNSKDFLEKYFEKNITIQHIKIFSNNKSNELDVLSEDLKGIYVRNLKKRGIIINDKGELIGFVEKTGSVGYVTKWWQSEFPVTIEATDLVVVGYYKKYQITIPDPIIIPETVSGKVYLSEYLPYGKLLRNFGRDLGEFKNGNFEISIPKISKRVVLLEEYNDAAQ